MNVKPGDLAIIIGVSQYKNRDCVGRIVSVGSPSWKWSNAWRIDFLGAAPDSVSMRVIVVIDDHNLRPVSGLPDAEQTDQQEPIKELA